MLSTVFNLNGGIITPNFAVQIPHPRCSMLIQGIHNLIHVLTKHIKKSNLHLPCRLLIARVEFTHGTHLALGILVLPSLIRRILGGIFGDVLWANLSAGNLPSSALILKQSPITFDLDVVSLWISHQQRRSLSVEGIRRVWVS